MQHVPRGVVQLELHHLIFAIGVAEVFRLELETGPAVLGTDEQLRSVVLPEVDIHSRGVEPVGEIHLVILRAKGFL